MTDPLSPLDMTLDELRPLLAAALPRHAAFDGWNEAALAAAAQDVGVPADRARLAFPGGAIDMIDAYIAHADARLSNVVPQTELMALKIRARITTLIRQRLMLAADEREAIRRALAILALPTNAARAARLWWRSADHLWRLAGDTATDFNHYSKRLILGSVYAATVLVWLDDDSDGQSETLAFLDRRIEDVMKIETAKQKWRQRRTELPSLARFLGRLRYPAI